MIPLLRNQGSLHRKRPKMPNLLESPEECVGNTAQETGEAGLEGARDVKSIDVKKDALKISTAAA